MHTSSLVMDILNFWFEREIDYNKWFFKISDYDKFISKKFSRAVRNANRGYFLSWLQNPQSYLALVILLHSFPKFIYRNTSRAYSMDKKCILFIEMGLDMHLHKLTTPQQVTLLLAYSTVENVTAQQFAIVTLRSLLQKSSTGPSKSLLRRALRHHEDCIAILLKFSRFPDRNVLYNQESSEEEIDYIDEMQQLSRV